MNQLTEPETMRRPLLHKLFFPVSPLTVLSVLSVLVSVVALIRASTTNHSAAMLAAISMNLTFVILALYAIDRLLIKKLAYHNLVAGELVFGILLFIFVTFQDRTIELIIHTDQDFTLIVFDSKENTRDDFKRSGLWSQELQIEHQTIIHLDSTLATSPRLRIMEPDHWMGYFEEEGRIQLDGHSVKYLFRSRAKTPAEQALLPPLDSLLNALTCE